MQTKRNAGIEYVRGLLRRGRGTFSRQDAAQELGTGSSLSNKLAPCPMLPSIASSTAAVTIGDAGMAPSRMGNRRCV
jgi:hypothetical protein